MFFVVCRKLEKMRTIEDCELLDYKRMALKHLRYISLFPILKLQDKVDANTFQPRGLVEEQRGCGCQKQILNQ